MLSQKNKMAFFDVSDVDMMLHKLGVSLTKSEVH